MDSPRDDKTADLKRIGKYDVFEVLGRGGMGVVYRAIDRQIGREVAIKTLTQGVAGDPEMLARFYEEGRKTGRLNHPHIVTVYDLGEDNGVPYIVMQRVEGDSLDKVIARDTQLPMTERLRIIEETCSALAYAHNNNVIHRDVKPANIFVQPDGKAKLLDFGIARLERRSHEISLTRTGHIIGTVPYMAPERLRDKMIDGRSDIFSIGVVLHQFITGYLPFSGEDYVLMQKILNEAHPPLRDFCADCPSGLQEIVDKSLAKQVDDRYHSAEEMAADLRLVIEELGEAQVGDLLPQARRLVDAQDFTRARVVLQQVLKVQSKHTGARELLGEIQRKLSQRQRDERLKMARAQALEALGRRDFEQSLSIVKDGLELDSGNVDLLELRDKIQQERRRQEQIDAFLRQADQARRKGDVRSALAAVQEALSVDANNSKILALCHVLESEVDEADRKAKARTLLDLGRRSLDARNFEHALEVLRQVEQLTPGDPEVQMLIADAGAGVEQKRRRGLVTQLEEQLSLATTTEMLQSVSRGIQEALVLMPSDPMLFRLGSQVERRLADLENRRLVEDTLQKCRDLRPREALEFVRRARETLPDDEKLMSLESLLTGRLQQQSVEQRRGEYLSRAREAINTGVYADAIQMLEACEAEGIASQEVLSLLEFARSEEKESQTQKLKRNKLVRAQYLVNEGLYDEAVAFLESSLQELDDTTLRLLLEQASNARQAVQRQGEAALVACGRLVQSGKIAEALQLLKTLPKDVLRSARVQMAIISLEDEQRVILFRMAGRAYGMLDNDLSSGHRMMQRVAAASGEASPTAAVALAYQTREQAWADRALTEAVQKSETLLRSRDTGSAETLVRQMDSIVDLASPQKKTEWKTHSSRLGKKGLRGRISS